MTSPARGILTLAMFACRRKPGFLETNTKGGRHSSEKEADAYCLTLSRSWHIGQLKFRGMVIVLHRALAEDTGRAFAPYSAQGPAAKRTLREASPRLEARGPPTLGAVPLAPDSNSVPTPGFRV